MIDNIQEKFLVEAKDFISSLEDNLLLLEKSPNDERIVNEVFRIMHSLKGSGAMFGFMELSGFTHHLENIYDLIRDKKLEVNKRVLNLSFESIDLISSLLSSDISDAVKKKCETVIKKINDLTDGENTDEIDFPSVEIKKNVKEKKIEKFDTYYIYFQPFENVMKNGTNPLYLLDELCQMGESKVICRPEKIPDIDFIDEKLCYTIWEIFISTVNSRELIQDVFIFVEDESVLRIEKIADSDLFKNSNFNEYLESYETEKTASIDVRNFVESLKFETELIDDEIEIPTDKNIIESDDVLPGDENSDIDPQQLIDEDQISKVVEEVSISQNQKITTIRVPSDKLDKLMNLASEMVTHQARLNMLVEFSGNNELITVAENLQKLSRQFREIALEMSLIPIHDLVIRFRRLIRDLANDLNKEVEFKTEGTDTELDKSIIEKISDPLMHILRNCMDHGIEEPEERLKAGKAAKGEILFRAYYSGAYVNIQIEDDGRGLDPEKIYKKALKSKLIDEGKELNTREIIELLCMPGFTTSSNVTDISGRGVGMNVVRKEINDLRGELDIESELGKFTRITIRLPLTLSIIDGLLTQVCDNLYIIPISSIEKIFEVQIDELRAKKRKILEFEGEQIPFLDIEEEFDLPTSKSKEKYIVVVHYEKNRMGLVVDSILMETQAVLKPMGRYMKYHEIFSGATILGDGSVALVMDTNKVINKFTNI